MAALSPKRVLIVDDSPFARARIRDVIESGGHEVVGEAADAPGALELYQQLRPDIVTMDLIMPGVDGVGAIQVLRVLDPTCRIVLITAVRHNSTIDALLGMDVDVIHKPVNLRDLDEAFTQALGRDPAP